MKRALIGLVAALVIVVAGFLGYTWLTQPELDPVPPIPPAASSALAPESDSAATSSASADGTVGVTVETAVDTAAASNTSPAAQATAPESNILVIEVAGSVSGRVEILLNTEKAPNHAARIRALARAGAYDGVVFHRVIEGFMAQTGDVQFGQHDAPDPGMVGRGGSDMPDLKAEFSDQAFVKGVVGMARSSMPDSANSQFFIMFDAAPFLNGQYTVLGRVISGQDVVDRIRKGDADRNGTVSDPDYMARVYVKGDAAQ